MARNYQVVVGMDALDALPKTGTRLEMVLAFLRSLGANAAHGGNFSLLDKKTGGTHEHSIVAGYIVAWWVDAPANQVCVVEIGPTS